MTNAEPFKIVVGIDFSEQADQALDRALAEAGRHACAEVHVVHVEPDYRLGSACRGHALGADATVDLVERRTWERMDSMLDDLDKTPIGRVVAHYRHGSAVEGIAQLARQIHADLIIIGSHGRGGASPFRGSVAERIERLVDCPVHIVSERRSPSRRPPPKEHARHADRAERRTCASNGIYAAESTLYESAPSIPAHAAPH